MLVRANRAQSSRLVLPSRRTLFGKFKSAQKRVESFKKDESFHHEYSIRPDTFAFKVSGANEKSRSLTVRTPNTSTSPGGDEMELPKSHPLQKGTDTSAYNVMDFIYRNATNYPFEDKTPQEVFNRYPSINSLKLGRSKTRPKKIKMLTSDFIEDSLYNPNYGYFSQEVEIFHQDKPFDYNNIADVDDFMEHWSRAYAKYEDPKIKATKEANANRKRAADSSTTKEESTPATSTSKFVARAKTIEQQELARTGQFQQTKNSLQLWHTPTELFSPFYGEALARYLLVNYKLNGHYPYHDLIIYEMGGGNGTLMCNILNYIKETQPDVYARTQYKIIEISSQLAEKQKANAMEQKLVSQGLDSSKVEIINKSIFHWDTVVNEPCYFIALEVFDNFSHDLIRYDNNTGEPYQGHVVIDDHGDFYEFFTPELSPYANAYLQLRENGSQSVLQRSGTTRGKLDTMKSLIPFGVNHEQTVHPLLQSSSKLRWKHSLLPFKDNLTPGEFIPTRLLQFFQILKHKFPNHSLVCSDFHYLPKSIPGYYNAPVVQTVLQDTMVDVSTYMCYQGYFDIMFPTDFAVASDLYRQVTGKVPRVESHREFLEQWADAEATVTKKGENPMLDFYSNVSFMVS
ncbi:hypothetical protein CAAN1_10S00320 [[Candida] anglica]|uniref:type II protein arginine methyltransferase n=1 Tax=[Candida] anglica TaxID=148631 RepID=A0ABP0EIP5_9ASCO